MWSAPRRTSQGGQWRYSDLAIETCLTLKRLEHRSGDEASRVCGCPSGGGQYRPQDLRRGGMARPREYAAAGANSTSDWTWPAVRLFAPI